MTDPATTPNTSIAPSLRWREYTAAAIQAAGGLSKADLTHANKLPREVVLKAAGNLVCTDAKGGDGTLTGLPAWYRHPGAVSAIGDTQAVDIIVYW